MKPTLDDLVQKVIDGDAAAWCALWLAVERPIWVITGKPQVIGRLSLRDDERASICVAVMDRLRDNDFAALRGYAASRARLGRGTFDAWLRVVATNTARDCVRRHPEYIAPTQGEAGDPERSSGERWVRHAPLTDRATDRGLPAPRALRALETQVAVTDLLDRAADILTPAERGAVMMHMEDATDDEIASKFNFADGPTAKRIVHAALARLRHRYAG